MGRIATPIAVALALTWGVACNSSVSPQKARVAAPGGNAEALQVVSVEPPPGRTEIGPTASLRLTFNVTVDAQSLTDESVEVIDLRSGGLLPGATELDAGGREVTFAPAGGFPPAGMYEVRVAPGLRSVDGGSLDVSSDGAMQFPIYYSTFSDPPRLVGSIAVSADSASSIRLDWDDAVDRGTPAGELIYEIFAAPSDGVLDFQSAPQALSDPGATEGVVTGLLSDTEYQLAIRARDDVGSVSAPSTAVLGRTKPADDADPPTFGGVTELIADPEHPDQLLARWEPAVDAQTQPQDIRYNVYVALASGAQEFAAPTLSTAPGATEAVIEQLVPDTAHFVVVRAVDSSDREETNEEELSARTPVSFAVNVFPLITLPAEYDPAVCWPPDPVRVTGGCAQSGCHTATRRAGGVSLQTYAGFLAPSTISRRPPVVPGNPNVSTILQRMRRKPGTGGFMPSGASASVGAECILSIERWIVQGAKDN